MAVFMTNLASFCDGRNCWPEAQNLCKAKATGQFSYIYDGYMYEYVSGTVLFASCYMYETAMISPSLRVVHKVCLSDS